MIPSAAETSHDVKVSFLFAVTVKVFPSSPASSVRLVAEGVIARSVSSSACLMLTFNVYFASMPSASFSTKNSMLYSPLAAPLFALI